MRVTKAIREYVEEEVTKKYKEKIDSVGKEYCEEKDKVLGKITEILNEANNKANDYLNSVGYKCYRYGSETERVFTIYNNPCNYDAEQKIAGEKGEIMDKMHAKVKQILFDLEMGETAKAELKELLDNLVVD